MNSYGEQIEKQVLCTAFSATCEKRKSIFSKDDIETTLHLVSNDLHMAELWGQFQKSNYPEIFQTASGKSVSLLSWSHYAVLLQVKDKEARDWYEKEAAEQTWSFTTEYFIPVLLSYAQNAEGNVLSSTAGNRALNSLRTARENLNSAKNWGLVDMFGGGFFTTMLKHSKMDQAKQNMEQAKYDLRNFSKELNDVNLACDLHMDTGDFLSFADYFFDGFVVDCIVQDRINTARRQVDEAIRRTEYIINQLQHM